MGKFRDFRSHNFFQYRGHSNIMWRYPTTLIWPIDTTTLTLTKHRHTNASSATQTTTPTTTPLPLLTLNISSAAVMGCISAVIPESLKRGERVCFRGAWCLSLCTDFKSGGLDTKLRLEWTLSFALFWGLLTCRGHVSSLPGQSRGSHISIWLSRIHPIILIPITLIFILITRTYCNFYFFDSRWVLHQSPSLPS